MHFLKNCPDFCGTHLNFVNSFTSFTICFAFLHCHDHPNTLLNVLMSSSVYKHIGMNFLTLSSHFVIYRLDLVPLSQMLVLNDHVRSKEF